MRFRLTLLSIFAVVLLTGPVVATSQVATGVYPFGAFDSNGVDTINAGNLNTHLAIPVFSKSGRGGMNFSYSLIYDSSIWTPTLVSGSKTWLPAPQWGWQPVMSNVTGNLSFTTVTSKTCRDTIPSSWLTFDGFFVYTDTTGRRHGFSPEPEISSTYCASGIAVMSATANAVDGSGFVLIASSYGNYAIQLPNGSIIQPEYNSTVLGTSSVTDDNGNQISSTASTVVDTTGTTVLTLTGAGTSSSPRVFTYPTYVSGTAGTAPVTVTYVSYNIKTVFGCAGVSEYSSPSTVDLVDNIAYPDGQTYRFTYEATPGFSGKVTGRLASIQLPTGGTISYAYSGGTNGINCSDGSAVVLARATSDGTATYTRSSITSTTSLTSVQTGALDHTTYDFIISAANQSAFYPTHQKIYDGPATGTPRMDVAICYNGNTSSCDTTVPTTPFTELNATTTLDGASSAVAETDTFVNANSQTTEIDQYDYGTSSHGLLLQKTINTYGYAGYFLTATQMLDISGDTVSNTSYAYDGTTPTPTFGLPQHVSVSTARGNLTSVTYCATFACTGTGARTTTLAYDDTGSVISAQNNPDSATTIQYDASTNTFPARVTYPSTTAGGAPVAHVVSAITNISTGLQTSSTDQNGNVTNYSYDSMFRPTLVQYPTVSPATARAQTSWAYTPASFGPFQNATVETDVARVSGSNIKTVATLDTYGRSQTVTLTDSSGNSMVDSTYDPDGRLHTQSNPHRSASSTTDGATTYGYDSLNRTVSVLAQDGLSSSTSVWTGNADLLTDAATNQRKIVVDALGRTSMVKEPDNTGSFTYETDYLYLQGYSSTPGTYETIINQKGGSASSGDWHTRTFTYDLMGRTVSELIPEAGYPSPGTISYRYLNAGSPCAGDVSAVCVRTDNLDTTTTYAYDGLDRLVGKTYSGTGVGLAVANNTPSVTYYYDQASYNGLTSITNPIGNLTGMSDGSGMTAWQYDTLGRPTEVSKKIGTTSPLQSTVTYNLDSTVNTLTDFGGTTLTYAYDNTGRPTGITDGSGNSYAGSAAYAPPGLLTGITHQMSGGTSYTRSNQYNSMLQPTLISAAPTSSPSSPLMSYSYVYGSSGHNNSNISSITDSVNAGWNQNFTYDTLNRLKTASNPDTTHGTDWTQTFTIDPWGTLTDKSQSGSVVGTNLSTSDTYKSNQLAALSYDGAGRVTGDGYTSYTYDAEGRILTTSSNAYVYDGGGNRVEKSVSGTNTLYWPGVSGQIIDESNNSASTIAKQVYFGGMLVWRESAVGNPGLFLFQDHLGSTRLTADASGTVKDSISYYPFGEIIPYSSISSDNHYGYTGDEEDGDSDYAVYRNANFTWGRFNRPDPYDGSYDATNPQSLNRYAYVMNRPLSYRDSLGLASCVDEGFDSVVDGRWGTTVTHTFDIVCVLDNLNIGDVIDAPGGGGGGSGTSDSNDNITQIKPFINPLRDVNYFKATCYGDPLMNSKYGCPVVCTATEEWGPFEMPTAAAAYLTQKQLVYACGSLAEAFCPVKVTVEGNYEPITGIAPAPYVNSCHM